MNEIITIIESSSISNRYVSTANFILDRRIKMIMILSKYLCLEVL